MPAIVLMSAALRRHDRKPCPYCGRVMVAYPVTNPMAPTRDHIRPKTDGGRVILVCCRTCNGHKGNLALVEWLHELKMAGDFRIAFVKKVIRLYANLAEPSPDRVIGFNHDMVANSGGKVWYCNLCGSKFLTRQAAVMHARSPKHAAPRVLTEGEALLARLRAGED